MPQSERTESSFTGTTQIQYLAQAVHKYSHDYYNCFHVTQQNDLRVNWRHWWPDSVRSFCLCVAADSFK